MADGEDGKDARKTQAAVVEVPIGEGGRTGGDNCGNSKRGGRRRV